MWIEILRYLKHALCQIVFNNNADNPNKIFIGVFPKVKQVGYNL